MDGLLNGTASGDEAVGGVPRERTNEAHGASEVPDVTPFADRAAWLHQLETCRDLEADNDRLAALLAAEQKHVAVINSLGSIFDALYLIDLVAGTVQKLVTLNGTSHASDTRRDARAFMEQAVERAAPEHRPSMRLYTDLDTVDDRLGSQPIISHEYMTVDGTWVRCGFIAMERDEAGRNVKVIFSLRRITAEKEALERQDNIIRALSMPYENVYAVDMGTGQAVCYRMGQAISDRYGSAFAVGDYERNAQAYISNDVLGEDRPLFDRVRTLKGMAGLLADEPSYTFTYRVLRNGRQAHFQCQVVKPADTRNEFVIAFKNIDDQVGRERANQRVLDEQLRIIDALSREYHSLFKIDARRATMELYRTDGIGMDPARIGLLMEAGGYHDVIDAYVETCVAPEDRARIKESTRLDVLLEKVPDVGLYKLGYQRLIGDTTSYYEMSVAKTIDGEGSVVFIMGLRDVSDEMLSKMRRIRAIEERNEIIEGLGSEYYSVLLVDPAADTVVTYRAQDEGGRAIEQHFLRHENCWSKGIRSYAAECIHEAGRAAFLEETSLERLRAGSADYSFTYEKIAGDGVMYLQTRVSFVRGSDGRAATVVGTRNVDDLIRRERQQEAALQAAFDAAEAANRAKTDFLSSMSHDIRTPMNGIIGMTAIAAAHIDDKERVRDSLQKITQASKHLLSLINEVLDMSRIESGKVELVEEEFRLSDLIDNLLSITGPQIEEHRHSLSVNIAGVVHEAVVGDSLRIQKVFTNLMSNAVKFTPDGGTIKLTITEKPSSQARVGCYEFVFEDNGIGMSEGFLDRVFEPFARETIAHGGKIQGTGLGMPISRNVVRMMGGDIKVESKLGVGSRFTVTVYLKLQDGAQAADDRFADLDVLVADDDALSLESCCGMLDDLGMRAEGVPTGAQAVERVVARNRQGCDFFACIIDWKMPDMDGIATTRAIRAAVGPDVPIVIISAYDWSDIEQEARAAGANAFVSKPLFRSRLATTFDALVGKDGHTDAAAPLSALTGVDLTGRRALVVEDNELNAEIAVEILASTGLSVELAEDGSVAVDRMATCPDGYFDIVFMDIQMPHMNGYDATRAIRAMDRAYCQKVPIVAMTANAFAEDVQAAHTVGMNEHVAKPLDMEALAKTLRRWLG